VSFTTDLAGFLPDLAVLVNRSLVSVPPGWTLTPARLGVFLRSPSAWAVHYPEPPAFVKQDMGVVADGRLLAAGQYAVVGRTCYLCWLAADPGEPGALEELLEELKDLATGQGCDELAQSRNELGVGWFGTPLCWDHVFRGLREAGWEPGDRWLVMTGETDAAAPVLEPPFRSIRLDRSENPEALEWSVDARVGDVPAADCTLWGLPELFRDCPGCAEWMTLESIDVEEPFQRHGIALWLVGEQMRWLAGRGFRHVLLFTETGNLPARGCFEKAGFVPGPECWVMRRSLHPR